MNTRKTAPEWSLPLTMMLGGGAAVVEALRASWHPDTMSPGIESCLVPTVTGFILALLHPLPYRHALALCAPLLFGGYFLYAHVAGAAAGRGILGAQLAILGVVGLALALLRETRSEAAPTRALVPDTGADGSRGAASSRGLSPSGTFPRGQASID